MVGSEALGVPSVGFGSGHVTPTEYVSELAGLQTLSGRASVEYRAVGAVNYARTAWQTTDDNGTRQPGLTAEYFASENFDGSPALKRIEPAVDLNWYTQTIPGIGDGPLSIRYTGTFQPLISGDHLIKVAGDGSVRVAVNGNDVINTFEVDPGTSLLGRGTAHSVKISLVAGQTYSVLIETRKPAGGFGSFLGALGSAIGIHAGWTSLDVPTDLASYDAVIVSAGFNSANEGENFDRSYELPDAQSDLIRKIAAINPRTIVVLHSGGSVETESWIGQVPVVLHAWYSGQYGGQALAEILFGDVNPSAKLPVTFERRFEDSPAAPTYPSEDGGESVRYREGVFVGYRGFEASGTQPLFPFGYGLSHTRFRYSDLRVWPPLWVGTSEVNVSFNITNTGRRAGAEAAQVYVGKINSRIVRPQKELKGFEKVFLRPGESKRVTVSLDRRAFS